MRTLERLSSGIFVRIGSSGVTRVSHGVHHSDLVSKSSLRIDTTNSSRYSSPDPPLPDPVQLRYSPFPPQQQRSTKSSLLSLYLPLTHESNTAQLLLERRPHLYPFEDGLEISILLDGSLVVVPFLRLDDEESLWWERVVEGLEDSLEACVAGIQM